MATKKKSRVTAELDEMTTALEERGLMPKVVKGSHLTVTTYPDGRTELEWDDEALMRDVQEALASVSTPVEVVEKPKRTRKKKEA